MATSPITKDDFEALSSSSDACEAFKALLRIPGSLNLFLAWLLDGDGAISEEAAATASDYLTPIGAILLWSGSNVPTDNWRVCNGQALSRTTYDTLFSRCGTTWGSGDGSTTFNIPNFQDRIPVGAGSYAGLGQTAGSRYVTLTEGNMPAHTHDVAFSKVTAPDTGGVARFPNGDSGETPTTYTATSTSKGSGQPFDALNPVTGVYFIIKVK